MKEDFRLKAINPQQYDSPGLNWETETHISPVRKHFSYYLESQLGDLTGKKVIDIGSGTGYLTELYSRLGANYICGVEPSKDNVAMSKKLYPAMEVFNSSIESFNSEIRFNVAVSVMVFEHIDKPDVVFRKIYELLTVGGKFFLIVADKTHFMTPRHNYNIQVQELGNGEVAVETQRPQGLMYDIVRPIENYQKYAENAGFTLTQSVPMLPTEDLMRDEPKYSQFRDKPLTHLLIFKR